MDVYRIERVAYLVGDPSGKRQDGVGTFALKKVLSGDFFLSDVAQYHDMARMDNFTGRRSTLAVKAAQVQPNVARLRIVYLDLAGNGRNGGTGIMASAEVQAKRMRQPRNEFPEDSLANVALSQPDDLVGCRVRVLDDPAGTYDEDTLLNGVKHRLKKGPLTSKALDKDGKVRRVKIVYPPKYAIKRAMPFTRGGHGTRRRH